MTIVQEFFSVKKEKLKERAIEIAKNRFKNNEDYNNRLDYEINLLEERNDLSYINCMTEIVQFIESNKLFFIAKGKLNCSLLCYYLGISNIDPIKEDIPFSLYWDKSKSFEKDYFRIDTNQESANVIKQSSIIESVSIPIEIIEYETGFRYEGEKLYLPNFSKLDIYNLGQLDIIDFDKNNKEVYDVIASGDLSGIYDFAQNDIAEFLKEIKVKRFEDLTFILTLFYNKYVEKDAVKHCRMRLKYKNEELNRYLSKTNHYVIFEEQWVGLLTRFLNCEEKQAVEILYKYKKSFENVWNILIYDIENENLIDRLFRIEKRKLEKEILSISRQDNECLIKEIMPLLTNSLERLKSKSECYSMALMMYYTAYLKSKSLLKKIDGSEFLWN